MVKKPDINYKSSGVNIDLANQIKSDIGSITKASSVEGVGEFGSFGSMYRLSGYQEPILVSSTDGVGTKLIVASLMNKYDSVGMDIVNHCVNDILCNGAKPLFFLDYIAMSKLIPEKVREIVAGMTRACKDVGCALIGGETAEMPGIYLKGTCDLAGFIVGIVEKKQLITGQNITEGDLIFGLRSNGLHTNGYSLARKVFGIKNDPAPLFSYYSQLGMNIGDSLLKVHRCYYNELAPLLPFIKGLAHITGGGFEGNISRIIPDGIAARLNMSSWEVPEIFNLIQQKGNIDNKEMYRVFNMGIGMVVICSPHDADKISDTLPEAIRLGEVIKKTGVKTILIG